MIYNELIFKKNNMTNVFNIPYSLNNQNNNNNNNYENNNYNNNNNILINNSLSNNKNIISLINSSIIIKLHEHPLIYCVTKDRNQKGWSCNICKTNNNYNTPSFYCVFCDFDLCKSCFGKMKIDEIFLYDYNSNKFNNLQSNNNLNWQIKIPIHNHSLSLIKRENKSNNLICNNCLIFLNNNDITYYCSLCNFNLCVNCVSKMNILKNNIVPNQNKINEYFQIKSFNILNEEYLKKNLIYSPLSIYFLFCLIGNGASDITLNKIKEVFSINDLQIENNINVEFLNSINNNSYFDLTNAIYSPFSFLFPFPLYISKYKSKYSQNIFEINNYIQEKTKNQIFNYLDNSFSNEQFLLINIFNFKGIWKKKFTLINQLTNFTNSNGITKLIQMMNCKDKFKYYNDISIEVIQIPFFNNDLSALILLPNQNYSIDKIISKLNQNILNIIYSKLKEEEINLIMPKFSFKEQNKLNLTIMLNKIGLNNLFNDKEANFNKILYDNNNKLCLNNIFQINLLDVDENGNELPNNNIFPSIFSSNKEVVVNRPFLFIIINNKFSVGKDIILFAKIEDF